MVSLKHKFITAKADGSDSTLVRPTGWNQEHDLVSIGDGIVLGRPAGLGPGEILEIAISALLNSGSILLWAGLTAPAGWYLCDGTVRPVSEAPLLAAVCGNRFGGDGTTTFATPDLRGRVVCGIDSGVGRAPGFNAPGIAGGGPQGQTGVNSAGVNNINFGNAGFVQTFGATVDVGMTIGNGNGATVPIVGPNSPVQVQGYTPINGNFNIGVSGTTPLFNIIQATMALNFIIKGG